MCSDAKSEQNFKNADMKAKNKRPETIAIKHNAKVAKLSKPKLGGIEQLFKNLELFYKFIASAVGSPALKLILFKILFTFMNIWIF